MRRRTPNEYDISVRELAEFAHRRSDLGARALFAGAIALLKEVKGASGFSKSQGSDYRPEVPVERSFVKGEAFLSPLERVRTQPERFEGLSALLAINWKL